jgi:hypothetical protein
MCRLCGRRLRGLGADSRPDEGETRQQFGQRVATIVYSVIPEINRQVFYRVMGLDVASRQRFQLD